MTAGRWVLAAFAGVVLVVSLTLGLRGHPGSLLTSAGMVFVLLAVWLGARQSRRDQSPQTKK